MHEPSQISELQYFALPENITNNCLLSIRLATDSSTQTVYRVRDRNQDHRLWNNMIKKIKIIYSDL